MRPGVRLGVDVGEVRIGVAVCDPAGRLATPRETLSRGQGDLTRLAELAAALAAIEIVVGLPRSLSGDEGAAARKARHYAAQLAKLVVPLPVRLTDERLTTVTATRELREAGVHGRRGRSVIDQASAVVILQSALDAERTSGRPLGQIISAGK